ncbi:hypothetical protein H4Q26_018039 [Puccinia striiformis f. sp. tritici PST-130]|nr:hypothetical protein H4Q26_018039 [Puccinia striiformis f. sp. tritici PST-130]
MSGQNNNDGFQQAMLKTALETTPQLSEENYSIWKDKMTALLQLRGVLTTLNDEQTDAAALADDVNAELILLFIAKIDSVTHNNVVTADNRNSARALWKAIKDRFASDESSNRARVFNEFLYVQFKEDALELFVTDIKVAIKNSWTLLLKRQIMHSDKSLTVKFVCDHLVQFNNENRAEVRESSSTNQAALISTKNQRSNKNNEGRSGQSGAGSNRGKRCTTGFHNPKQDDNHFSDSCWHLHPDKAPEWWREAQAKWQSNKMSITIRRWSLFGQTMEDRKPKSYSIVELLLTFSMMFNSSATSNSGILTLSEPVKRMRPSQSKDEAERANRTIVESMRATFRGSGNCQEFSGTRLSKSCCLALNQIPRKGSSQSPWEIMPRKKASFNISEALGTTAVVLNMNRRKRQKFDVKGQEGLLAPQFDIKMADWDEFHPDKPDTNDQGATTLERLGASNTNQVDQESPSQEETDNPSNHDNDDSHDSEEEIAEQLTPREQDHPTQVTTRILRDRATIKPPTRFGFHHYYKPNTFESAIRCSDEKFWRSAIENEITSIENHDVWDNHYQEPPNPLDTTWVFKLKTIVR